MLPVDWQRVLRGATLVAQEVFRLQATESRHAARLLRRHAAEVCSKTLPEALNTTLNPNAPPPPPPPPPPTPTPTATQPEKRTAPTFAISDAAVAAAVHVPVVKVSKAPPPPGNVGPPIVGAHQHIDSGAAPSPIPLFVTAQPPQPSVVAPTVPKFAVSPAESTMPAAASTSQADAASPPPRRREFREIAVPASPLARVWGFGRLAASLAAGAVGERISSAIGGGQAAPEPQPPIAAANAVSAAAAARPGASAPQTAAAAPAAAPPPVMRISPAQAERLAEGLCRMRGAALKLGQMLSLSDETLVPPQIAAVLERVRTQADVMPARQLEAALAGELGADWRARLGGDGFETAPVAAASIGQVHRATLADGRRVAVKVQYPGVAASIQSDIANLKALLTWTNFLPPGLYLDELLAVAKDELAAECDYVAEAAKQERFRALVGADADFAVPAVVTELSTTRVLVTEWLEGVPIDALAGPGYSQALRDAVARKLLKLTLRELFSWRFVQTDPNWGNFLYDARGGGTDGAGVVGLLDFGAAREYPRAFVDDYLRLVWAAANGDAETIRVVSTRLGFLTGFETPAMVAAHVASGLVVGEPFAARAGVFDFRDSGITRRVAAHGAVFAEQRLTPPPPEVYSLHRKLAGAFLICIRLGARMHCRDLLEEAWHTHQWGPESSAAQAGKSSPRQVS